MQYVDRGLTMSYTTGKAVTISLFPLESVDTTASLTI